MARLSSIVWFVGIALLFVGEALFKGLGMNEPEWFTMMKNNKVGTFIGLFILNNVGNSQLSTGAFEIYYNDELIFSKLASGRVPGIEDITQALALKGFA